MTRTETAADGRPSRSELLWAAQEMLRSAWSRAPPATSRPASPTATSVLTPSSLDYLEMTLDDLVVCDLDGNVVEGHRGPTSEKQLHLAVLAAYPEIGATMHCHAKHVQMFAVTHQPIPAVVEEFDVYVGGDVECSDYKETGSGRARRGGRPPRRRPRRGRHGEPRPLRLRQELEGHPAHRVARRAHRRGGVGRPGARTDRRGPRRDRHEVRLVLPLRPHREVRLSRRQRRRARVRPSPSGSITVSTRSSAASQSLNARIATVFSSVDGGVDDRTAPQHVVDEQHAAGTHPVEDLVGVGAVHRLVGVDEREVDRPLGGQRPQRVDRRRDAQLDPVGDARPRPTRPADRGPLLAHVAAEQPAARCESAGDAQRAVPGERADLDGAGARRAAG